MKIKNFSELHELFKQGAVSQQEYNDLKLKIMQNSSSKSYKFQIFLLLLCFVCGTVWGLELLGYVTPYYWQVAAEYEGEDVCLFHMRADGSLSSGQIKDFNNIKERKQACKCLHEITTKGKVADFGEFVKFIANDNNLYKEWMRKKLVGKKTADENGYIRTWLKFWFRDNYLNCE